MDVAAASAVASAALGSAADFHVDKTTAVWWSVLSFAGGLLAAVLALGKLLMDMRELREKQSKWELDREKLTFDLAKARLEVAKLEDDASERSSTRTAKAEANRLIQVASHAEVVRHGSPTEVLPDFHMFHVHGSHEHELEHAMESATDSPRSTTWGALLTVMLIAFVVTFAIILLTR